VLARLSDLPVDPLVDKPPVDACPVCGSSGFAPDADVMDTWMTSSLTPQITRGWGSDPMSMRVQGFEIIRTWLFYTIVQSELHGGRLPWRTALIAGWGLNEQGRKLSKRTLSHSAGGSARYSPDTVIEKFGADALRLWAAKARSGTDLRYNEKDVRAGRKFAVKLWNVGRFLSMNLGDFDPASGSAQDPDHRSLVDRWVLSHLASAVAEATAAFEAYDFMQAHQVASRMFWSVYCDRYLEMIKDQVGSDLGTRWTLWETYRVLLGLFAPFAPFVTEEMYQQFYREHEGTVSLHATSWPAVDPAWESDRTAVDQLAVILDATRALRSQQRLGNSTRLGALVLQAHDDAASALLAHIAEPLRIAARADSVRVGQAAHPSGVPGVTVDLAV
jgi:valyl-tRNA synthetase